MTRAARLTLVITAVAAWPAGAHAQSDLPLVSAPDGWRASPEHAEVIQQNAEASVPEGPSRVGARAVAYHAPGGGAALIGYALEIGVGSTGLVVRTRINELRDTPTVEASVEGGSKRTIDWQEKPDDTQKLVEARLTWADDSDGLLSISRVIWLKPKRPDSATPSVMEYRVECVLALDVDAALRAACEHALETLVFEPVEEREAIQVAVAKAVEDVDDDGGDGAAPAPEGTTPSSDTPSMKATPDDVKMPPLVVPPKKSEGRDWRPFWIVGGLVLVGGALLYARQRKKSTLDALEREEEERKAKDRKPEPEKSEKPEPKTEKTEKLEKLDDDPDPDTKPEGDDE